MLAITQSESLVENLRIYFSRRLRRADARFGEKESRMGGLDAVVWAWSGNFIERKTNSIDWTRGKEAGSCHDALLSRCWKPPRSSARMKGLTNTQTLPRTEQPDSKEKNNDFAYISIPDKKIPVGLNSITSSKPGADELFKMTSFTPLTRTGDHDSALAYSGAGSSYINELLALIRRSHLGYWIPFESILKRL